MRKCVSLIRREKRLKRALESKSSGVLAMEAMISLTFFMFFMLALYSIITLFMAQSTIGHTLSVTSQSLSLETYSTDKLETGWSVGTLVNRGIKELLGIKENINQNYVSDNMWYRETYGTSADVQNICEQRFYMYLAGGESEAKDLLKKLQVVDGPDFSESKLDGNDLTITVKYKIRLLFGFRTLGIDLYEFDSTQSVCSRIWGKPDL